MSRVVEVMPGRFCGWCNRHAWVTRPWGSYGVAFRGVRVHDAVRHEAPTAWGLFFREAWRAVRRTG